MLFKQHENCVQSCSRKRQLGSIFKGSEGKCDTPEPGTIGQAEAAHQTQAFDETTAYPRNDQRPKTPSRRSPPCRRRPPPGPILPVAGNDSGEDGIFRSSICKAVITQRRVEICSTSYFVCKRLTLDPGNCTHFVLAAVKKAVISKDKETSACIVHTYIAMKL